MKTSNQNSVVEQTEKEQTSRTEYRAQKYTPINTVKLSLIKEQRQLNGANTETFVVSSTNGARKNRHPYTTTKNESRDRLYTLIKINSK